MAAPAWNNVLALSAAPPPAASSAASDWPPPPREQPSSHFVSPFAALTTCLAPVRPSCGRCRAALSRTSSQGAATDAWLCLCCKRPLVAEAFDAAEQSKTTVERRCRQCVAAAPDLLVALVAEVPSLALLENAVDAAIEAEDAAIASFNRLRDALAELPALVADQDARVQVVETHWRQHEMAMEAHLARRQAAACGDDESTNAGSALFDSWLALLKERVSLRLQRLVVLDQFLATHFLLSPPAVAQFLVSQGFTPGQPFPVPADLDESDLCYKCENVLVPPTPSTRAQASVGFCDCCNRTLPSEEVKESKTTLLSLCQLCTRRRAFRVLLDDDLVVRPPHHWLTTLADVIARVGKTLSASTVFSDTMAGRLDEAYRDLVHARELYCGLQVHLAAVVKETNTSLGVSRHGFSEQFNAIHGVVAALLMLLLLYTEAGAQCGRDVWGPVMELVNSRPWYATPFPKWLMAFVQERDATFSASEKTTPAPLESPDDSDDGTWIEIVEVRQPSAPPTPTATAIQSTPKKKAKKKKNQHPGADLSQAAESTQLVPHQAPMDQDFACPSCNQTIEVSALIGRGEPSCCDCCEMVISTSLVGKSLANSSVSLCKVCSLATPQTKTELQRLQKRPHKGRINTLSSHAGSMRTMLSSAPNEAIPDTRRLSVTQEVERWKTLKRALRVRERAALLPKATTTVAQRRSLYAERVEIHEGLLQALIEYVQVYLEALNDTQIELSPKMKKTLSAVLSGEPVGKEPVEQHNTRQGDEGESAEQNCTREAQLEAQVDPALALPPTDSSARDQQTGVMRPDQVLPLMSLDPTSRPQGDRERQPEVGSQHRSPTRAYASDLFQNLSSRERSNERDHDEAALPPRPYNEFDDFRSHSQRDEYGREWRNGYDQQSRNSFRSWDRHRVWQEEPRSRDKRPRNWLYEERHDER